VTRKTIYLIRHGETDFNLQGIVQGSGVNSSLNETGKNQANQFYMRYKSIPFQVVITSNLNRTIETASPFIESGIPHYIYPEFNEIDWGILEGEKPTSKNRQEFRNMLATWSNGDYTTAIEGGETPWQVHERMKQGISRLNEINKNPILIVSHGRAMRILLCTILNKPLSVMDSFPHNNTSLYQLEWDKNEYQLVVQNDLSHLG
jgi:broad specificity phosphatase PhoE